LQVLVAVVGNMGAVMTLRSDADVHVHAGLNLAAGVAAGCLLGSNISGETLQTVRHSTDQETGW
jgi:uncharacterized membrane protein YgaE (UPF0421/DUF939 family)